jgi:hypothetical protein
MANNALNDYGSFFTICKKKAAVNDLGYFSYFGFLTKNSTNFSILD